MMICTLLNKVCKQGCLAIGISGLLICSASATTAFVGDNHYQQNNYEQAHDAYMAAVETGSPHVYYQLGTIYFKGQGTKPNYLSALLWFSLAAEYQFSDAEKIAKQLLENIDEKDKVDTTLLISEFKKKYGKQNFTEKHLPRMLTANLNKKVTFGGMGRDAAGNLVADKNYGIESIKSLSEIDINDDHEYDVDPFVVLTSIVDPEIADDYDSYSEDTSNIPVHELNTYDLEAPIEGILNDPFGDIQGSKPPKMIPFNLPFVAIIDYELAADGSIRNVTKEYSTGKANNVKTAMYEHSLYTLPMPTFEGERINFFNRDLLGIARLDAGEARDQHQGLYDWIRRENKKLSQENTSQSNYKRAMLLTYYPWFPQKDGFAISLLKHAADEGNVHAQYEYGLYLYREQIDPAQAINYLSLASQFGLAKAQYTLARILQNSPWVETDERKSLFWHENAAKSGHSLASLRSSELKLLANDESLHNQAEAIDILRNIEPSQDNNPDYNYLVAFSHLRGKFRNYPKMVKHLRLAISRGHKLNWDVSKWEDQLQLWTSGEVTIKD